MATAAKQVIRVTMFKIPKEENRDAFARNYKVMWKEALKDGKPYILSLECGPAGLDERSQGFNFVAKSVFASREDFDFYDVQCGAHQAFKAKAKDLGLEGVMTIYYSPVVAEKL